MFEDPDRSSSQVEPGRAAPASGANTGERSDAQDATPTVSMDRIMSRLEVLGLLDDLEMAQEVIDVFVYDAGQSLEELSRAVVSGDAKACERLAHRVKGSSLNLGVDGLGALARALEEKGRSGDLSGAPEIYANMRVQYDALCGIAQEILRKAA